EYEASGGVTEDYKNALGRLEALCNSSGSTFVYVIIPDTTDYAHIKFIFSTMNSQSNYTVYDFGYLRETTNDDYRAKYRALYEGESERELVVRDKGVIETDPHITAMVPLRDSSGNTDAILCVQRQMDSLTRSRNEYLRRITFVLLGLAALMAVSQGIYLSKVFIKPIKKITEEADRFAKDSVPSDIKLADAISNEDEIGRLAECIDRMEEQIKENVDDLTRITAEKERIGTELKFASRLQEAFIPNNFPAFPEHNEFELYASMDPAKEVGGDFYDFYMIDEDRLCAVIADVSGKGVPAALFMMACKMILQGCAMQGRSSADILTMANKEVCANNKENMFVSVWLGILELSTGRLTAANAGHEYPALMRAGGEYELIKDRHGLVMGAMDGVKYTEDELEL
ncbi:MAG: SpoIIE family protein phosphatase, partial [Clostridia bacterium]|nr:SpoIIE family protein phosphatase [Clostridia bacterium]